MKSNPSLSHRFCVYTDSTLETPARVFYVGKGNVRRLNNFQRNEIHDRIAAKYGLKRDVVFETDDENEALAEEIRLINEFQTYTRTGWGANLTLGGDGTSGRVWSDEERAAQSSRRLALVMTDEWKLHMSESKKAWWSDVENHQKMVEAHLNSARTVSDELKQHLSECAIERWSDNDTRKRLTQANKDRWSDDLRQKHSQAAIKRWSSQDQRKRASESAKLRWTEKEKIRAAKVVKDLWSNPDYRAKLSKPRTCKQCGVKGHMAKTCKRQKHD